MMGFLIQDLLDYAQIKQGKFRTNIGQFNIVEAVESVMSIQEKAAKDRGISLFADFSGLKDNKIMFSDEQRIK